MKGVYLVLVTGLCLLAPASGFAACKNYVGGVCLDKKPVVKKKAAPRKKTAPKVAPKRVIQQPKTVPQAPVAKSAAQCVTVVPRPTGWKYELRIRVVNYDLINTCEQNITAFLITNPCHKHIERRTGLRGESRKVVLKAKSRKTIIRQQPADIFRKGEEGLFGLYYFSSDPKARGSGFPKWPKRCG